MGLQHVAGCASTPWRAPYPMVMWAVIWVGAAISIGVAYLYRINDPRIHSILVALMAGFLGVVLFMIVINDRPFSGRNSISPDSYRVILHHLIESRRQN